MSWRSSSRESVIIRPCCAVRLPSCIATLHRDTDAVNERLAGCRDDLRDMLRLVKPQHFLPVHGEYSFLCAHAELAQVSP